MAVALRSVPSSTFRCSAPVCRLSFGEMRQVLRMPLAHCACFSLMASYMRYSL